MIATLSGIRGILNDDLSLGQVSSFCSNFAWVANAQEVLLARDTRSTGNVIGKAAAAAMMSQGVKVLDCGVISTPALFRESRLSGRPAVMVTASHNEPEFNGLKFIIDGRGIGKEIFDAVVASEHRNSQQFAPGSLRVFTRPAYVDDLVERFGAGSCEGARVALDLGGGAAISHAVSLFTRLGCDVVSVNDTPGVFSRRVDPVADDLGALSNLVNGSGCDIGLGFDCDGDRLVIMGRDGRKRTGDYMLSLALSELFDETKEKRVVVSQDTTQAVDDVAEDWGVEVYRSKVGEANVVGVMKEKGARLGGEGSSGGLIDGAFNYCRDSLLAAVIIIKALKVKGPKFFTSVPEYHQERAAMKMSRTKALAAIRKLERKYEDSDLSDGMKVRLSPSAWILIRPSGTEDVVRISAEAETAKKAAQIAKSFTVKLKELNR